MPWLPDDFVHPTRVDLSTGEHLRPIRADDVDIDFPAVMGSQARLFSIFGQAWGWPPADMSYELDRTDLVRHEREIESHESFNYALLAGDESELLGCVYVDPPEKQGADADVSWWTVDRLVGSATERGLDDLVPSWILAEWPFTRPRYVGVGRHRELTFAEWLALPDVEPPDAA